MSNHGLVNIWSDASFREDWCLGGLAFVVKTHEGTLVNKSSKVIDCVDSTSSEYLAAIFALESARDNGYWSGVLYTDSASVAGTLVQHRENDVRGSHWGLRQILFELLKELDFRIVWVSRRGNKEADRLSKLALQSTDRYVEWIREKLHLETKDGWS